MRLKAKEKRLLRQADPETAAYLNALLQYTQELKVLTYQNLKKNKRLEQEYQQYSRMLADQKASAACTEENDPLFRSPTRGGL
ncbi:hypothetical protein [Paenibacillus oceani]|uniref:Uncharacterized protein n=1 Tax=Paenibacillus oceani TaxID=2772510 RepID=A0A927CF54_9BACL|nr:hypothetical protein [Paenibacillus oceani]MBD2866938.1 hypothetical protein [Paenibacillus oceani]